MHSILNEKGDIMVQVHVLVTFEGKSYLTNVLTNPNTSEEEIYRLAYEQVQKQWQNN
ncbi:BA3454 family stress response protein [Neobacillus niacini]|uniref:BA3454 family stress response protein n=1 Tax=Neobacillus niacini TaxID=86668 RepID=UPI0039838A0A